MNKIFCFMEEDGEVFHGFLANYDAEYEIHVYSSVIDSCEGSLFYCIGEMVSIFWEQEEKCWIVTDIKEVYQLLEKLCVPLFEKIIYLEQIVERNFPQKMDLWKLLAFNCNIIPDTTIKSVLITFIEQLPLSAPNVYLEFMRDICISFEQADKKTLAFLNHICRLLLFMQKERELQISDECWLIIISMLMQLEQLPEYANGYLEKILNSYKYKEDNYYFVWSQFKEISLKKRAALDASSYEMLDSLYKKSYEGYRKNERTLIRKIPREERNPDCVLVLVIQYLTTGHAPTRTVMERCKTLKKMGKEVYLVNTSEQYILQGYVPFFLPHMGSIIEDYYSLEEMQLGEGEKVWFRQLRAEWPLWDRFILLEKYIKEIKPYYILAIGSGSILADLSGNIVPCASMALAFSTFPRTMNRMKILGRNLRQEELEKGELKDVIQSCFTFELKPQKKYFTRGQFQIPDDRFVLVIVGIRLDYEIAPEFCHVLNIVCDSGCHVVFAGVYDSYEKMKEENPALAQNSTFIGYCDDILALMEICDLYVNPKRLGGGFSVIEAFAKGVPGVVYLPSGDVYTAGGEEFSVKDLQQMEQVILKYKEDKKFYQMMSYKAKKRAELMTSSIEAIRDLNGKIVDKVEKEFW